MTNSLVMNNRLTVIPYCDLARRDEIGLVPKEVIAVLRIARQMLRMAIQSGLSSWEMPYH